MCKNLQGKHYVCIKSVLVMYRQGVLFVIWQCFNFGNLPLWLILSFVIFGYPYFSCPKRYSVSRYVGEKNWPIWPMKWQILCVKKQWTLAFIESNIYEHKIEQNCSTLTLHGSSKGLRQKEVSLKRDICQVANKFREAESKERE